jgi:hypothetical protein
MEHVHGMKSANTAQTAHKQFTFMSMPLHFDRLQPWLALVGWPRTKTMDISMVQAFTAMNMP